jgi:hypothetical protein
MRVISVTPAGRRRYLEALVPHLLAQRHVIDEHHWWLNTNDDDDARYVYKISAEHPDFFKVYRKPVRKHLSIGANIWRYFRNDSDADALYVRFDDDIVYMAPDAIENIVRFRLARRDPLLILGNIVNNAVCTHFHQRAALVPMKWGAVHNMCMDRNGWGSAAFAARLHAIFLDHLRRNELEPWKQVSMPIAGTRRFSINVISWLGRDLCDVPELSLDDVDEEPFLTETLPQRLGRPNEACNDALFAHFAFYAQRPRLEWTWPELVGHYQSIARQSTARPAPAEPVLRLVRDSAWQMAKPIRQLRAHARKRWSSRNAA